MAENNRSEQLQNLNPTPFAVPAEDELMRIAQPIAKDIVRRYLVETGIISRSDAEWYENECLLAAWRHAGKYDPNHVSRRTGRLCSFLSYLKFVMRAAAGNVASEKIRRDKILTMFPLDADDDLMPAIEIEALDAMDRPSEQEWLERRLDIESIAKSMSEPYREIARLVYLEGFSWAEVAKALGMARSSMYRDYKPVVERRMKRWLFEGAE